MVVSCASGTAAGALFPTRLARLAPHGPKLARFFRPAFESDLGAINGRRPWGFPRPYAPDGQQQLGAAWWWVDHPAAHIYQSGSVVGAEGAMMRAHCTGQGNAAHSNKDLHPLGRCKDLPPSGRSGQLRPAGQGGAQMGRFANIAPNSQANRAPA